MNGESTSGSIDILNACWTECRPAVFGVAYRLLGTVTDAEDVTHDVWLRAAAADLGRVTDMRAWLVTVAARRSYDILRSARARRELYVGPWLPEPLLTGPDASQPVIVDDSVTTAMLIVIQELSPPERVALVMHDVFDLDFRAVAEMLEVSVVYARQLASRARRRIASAQDTAHPSDRSEREQLLRTFKAAYEEADLAGLVSLLHPEVVYVTDGGGEVFAARKPILGRERVADVMVRVGHRWRPAHIDLVEVNGDLALRFHREGRVFSLDTTELRGGLIVGYRRVMNPEKLTHV